MDPLSLEYIFQNVPLVSLLDAARAMEGVEFYHGERRVTFTEEEWKAKGKPLPKKDRERRMSTLGKGAFMTTYRKCLREGAVGPDGVTRFAVKVAYFAACGQLSHGNPEWIRAARIPSATVRLDLSAFPLCFDVYALEKSCWMLCLAHVLLNGDFLPPRFGFVNSPPRSVMIRSILWMILPSAVSMFA